MTRAITSRLNRIAAQCGFTSTEHGNVITLDQQRAKLVVRSATSSGRGLKHPPGRDTRIPPA